MGRKNWHNGGKRDLGEVEVAESVTVWFTVSTGHSPPVGKHAVAMEADGAWVHLTFNAREQGSQPALIMCIIQELLGWLHKEVIHIVVLIYQFSKPFSATCEPFIMWKRQKQTKSYQVIFNWKW